MLVECSPCCGARGGKGRRRVRRGAILAVMLVVLAPAMPIAAGPPAAAADAPSFVVIMVDDMDARMVDALPRLQSLLGEQGLSFTSFYTQPVCCPARASFLRGQYPHNTGVLKNGPPNGGFSAFRNRGDEQSTIATWLEDAGYRTGLVGKYLNGYEEEAPKHVPPGWNRWFVYAGKGKYRTYRISDQGKLRTYGKQKKKQKQQYQTDVLARKAVEFIDSTGATQPLFLFLAPSAPHEPATPAQRHRKTPAGVDGAPRLPSFNEADMSDKSGIWSGRDGLSSQMITDIDGFYQRQVRSMFAVEDMIADVLSALERTSRLDNTYVFFTSDNGLHHGEHRIPGDKQTPFEEVIRAPLLVLGPGVPAHVTTGGMSSVVDLGPTIAELAGIAAPDFADGRSLVSLLDGNPPASWREAVLSELEGGYGGGFAVLRSGQYSYAVYQSGARELYDLDDDPYQLENLMDSAPQPLIDDLQAQLDALTSCGLEGPALCQEVDGGA